MKKILTVLFVAAGMLSFAHNHDGHHHTAMNLTNLKTYHSEGKGSNMHAFLQTGMDKDETVLNLSELGGRFEVEKVNGGFLAPNNSVYVKEEKGKVVLQMSVLLMSDGEDYESYNEGFPKLVVKVESDTTVEIGDDDFTVVKSVTESGDVVYNEKDGKFKLVILKENAAHVKLAQLFIVDTLNQIANPVSVHHGEKK